MFNRFESGPQYFERAAATEAGLRERILNITKQFTEIYGRPPELLGRGPGRLELLGNHLDYNEGITLSAAIDASLCAGFASNGTDSFRIVSKGINNKDSVLIIDPHTRLEKSPENSPDEWTNYFKGIISQLHARYGDKLKGCDIYIESNIPAGGGFSSSAALELVLAQGIIQLSGNIDTDEHPVRRMELVQIARNAENGPHVGASTGFLDQSTIANGDGVFLDYKGDEYGNPVFAERVETHFSELGYTFMVGIDPDLKHNLAHHSGGYSTRVRECELAKEYLSRMTGTKIRTLREFFEMRDTDPQLFNTYMNDLQQENIISYKRVLHFVTEMDRVTEGLKALKENDPVKFGKLMTESGQSALDNYNIDDYHTDADITELRWTYEKAQEDPDILGVRNMGGGFNNTTLILVKKSRAAEIAEKIQREYKEKFGQNRRLNMLTFNISPGVGTFTTR